MLPLGPGQLSLTNLERGDIQQLSRDSLHIGGIPLSSHQSHWHVPSCLTCRCRCSIIAHICSYRRLQCPDALDDLKAPSAHRVQLVSQNMVQVMAGAVRRATTCNRTCSAAQATRPYCWLCRVIDVYACCCSGCSCFRPPVHSKSSCRL